MNIASVTTRPGIRRYRHRPLRAPSQRRLSATAATAAAIADAANLAVSGAKPLPMTTYKLELRESLVRDLLG